MYIVNCTKHIIDHHMCYKHLQQMTDSWEIELLHQELETTFSVTWKMEKNANYQEEKFINRTSIETDLHRVMDDTLLHHRAEQTKVTIKLNRCKSMRRLCEHIHYARASYISSWALVYVKHNRCRCVQVRSDKAFWHVVIWN